MSKRRNKEREQEDQRLCDEGDSKMSERNLLKVKKAKQRAARDSSSSSDSSKESKKSNHSTLSPNRKQQRSGRRPRDSPDPQEKRPKQLAKPTEDVHEQRSKWDSPERSSSHRNSIRQRRNSRSRSRDRSERERDRDRERNRERDYNVQSSKERWQRSPAQRHRSKSSERKNRERDRQRRSPERRPVRRSQSPRVRGHHGGRDIGQRRQRNQRHDNRNKNEDDHYDWGKEVDEKVPAENDVPVDKEKPNFGLSGALTEDTNKLNGVVVKYSEPPEARKPKRRWRLYPFKGETALPTLHIHRQSCFLVGRDRKVVDLAVDHPSCSKQHAALQYRLVPFEREDGSHGKRVRLYLIDLDSANGTFLNNKKIDARKYYELMEKDVIKFGFSSREYVLLHENSKEDQEDDDVHIKDEPQDAPGEEANP
ncbi:FHA domain-containing protein DDL [Drosophila teissieri]|uniref:FHA domain-containing protein DDL n=1 Tax=Drosophila teissieri TaxID=7243 RepID=UPI001CBA1FB5|nr:FHA domain-containing protein DDL [Drosophila teissieri]